ncbi:MAG: T9SS type A sorting domain-containing protein [Ignavibacteria bacterium]|nr:T9SS type A sorting domain-containing protein [Ignavibacteria bacterium]
MRKKNIICFLLFSTLNFSLLTFNSYAQWIQQSVPIINWNNPVATLFRTTNAGYNWQAINNWGMAKISIVDTGYIYTSGYNNGKGVLYKSTNLGITWDSIISSNTFYYNNLIFFNRDTGLVSSGNTVDNQIWRTTNGGQSLQLITSYGGATSGKFFFVKEKVNGEYYGYLYYPQGWYLYYTTNSGVNWQYRQFLPIAVNSIYFINKDTGWATASTSVNYVMKTVDGGLNWVNQTVPYTVTNYDVCFANSRKGWVGCGNDERIYATSNGGTNWGIQIITGAVGSAKLYFTDSLTGWAQTSFNTIAHTTNGGGPITSTISNNKEIHNDYKLYQNYPNPFNQLTVIRYQLSIKSNVKIIIYDIKGRETAALVYKTQEPGTYEYDFDAGSLSSGVYLYSLIADGKRTDTRRMILIK